MSYIETRNGVALTRSDRVAEKKALVVLGALEAIPAGLVRLLAFFADLQRAHLASIAAARVLLRILANHAELLILLDRVPNSRWPAGRCHLRFHEKVAGKPPRRCGHFTSAQSCPISIPTRTTGWRTGLAKKNKSSLQAL